mgnify:CR=1 FL=1|jgi:DNA adenine methylase
MKKEEIKLKPLLKYPGGKSSELIWIIDNKPEEIENYIEPFVGGGAVYFAIDAKKYYINDISKELILLYRFVKSKSQAFFDELNNTVINNWNTLTDIFSTQELIDLYVDFRSDNNISLYEKTIENLINKAIPEIPMFKIKDFHSFKLFLKDSLLSKFKLIYKNEIKKNEKLDNLGIKNNLEAGVKAAYYTYIRNIYNNPEIFNKLSKQRQAAIYLFIREYCYSGMFRFNSDGGFNVPYGGISYNKKTLASKEKYYKSKKLLERLKNTEIYENDFMEFISSLSINKNDFMFLDPPYDTIFSEYDKTSFGKEDQMRLANFLINECTCNFMLVIKETPFIKSLYENKGLNIVRNVKKYSVSFMDRNEKEVIHLTITNYKRGESL